jgi:aspartate kinase
MFESCKALSLNSHELVLGIHCKEKNPAKALHGLQSLLDQNQIAFPQLLSCELSLDKTEVFLTGPQEIMVAVKKELQKHSDFTLLPIDYSTVTLTCTGATSPEITQKVLNSLNEKNLDAQKLLVSAMSLTVLVEAPLRKQVIEALHPLI